MVDGVAVRRFAMPMPRMSARGLLAFPRDARRAWSTFAAAASTFGPEILHVQCFSANGAYATQLSRSLDVPLVVTLQGETMMDNANIYDRSIAMRQALRWGLDRATAVTAPSRYVLADAESRFGLARGRGLVIPNGVDLDEAVAEQPLALPFQRFVLAVGRVVAKKGFDLLLQAFQRIPVNDCELGLVIGGSGPALHELVQAAATAGLADRVAFPGSLSRGQIAWAMRNAAVFVLPSRIEPFGIVVLEALRAGCPVVASMHGGATEIVRDGVDALVVDPLDTTALARAIACIIGDDGLAGRLRLRGPQTASAFAWPGIAGRYRALYERIRT